MQSGVSGQKEKWEQEVLQLVESKGSLAQEWNQAYWLLHKELEALRAVMDTFWSTITH